MSAKFTMSLVSRALFEQADVSPARINQILERRIGAGEEASLRAGHHYTSRVRKMASVPLSMISRKHRHLLVLIDDHDAPWRYLEWSRKKCSLRIPGKLPETLRAPLIGQELRTLVAAPAVLLHCIILAAHEEDDWLAIELDPGWIDIK